ncbi:putative B3 domain-containing protein Os04g0347400 [Helianthus annuus]|uniref:putative B3 domain-containing protein Os04g0347400 n=1 Tax=Helianthus annuus TaxID=4232 RepID=UPI000B90324D|nr:putative B3 domain-containing protein Os04g0347400 [Helianthus annuus]
MDDLPVLTDGWRVVVNNLHLLKNTWLLFRSIGEKVLKVYPFINNVHGESYITKNNYTKLGLTVIPDEFINMFYRNHELNGSYQVFAGGKYWDLMATKLHVTYAFKDGWPKLCESLNICDGDTLIFDKIGNVIFHLRAFRNGIEVGLGIKKEAVESDFCEIISQSTYQRNAYYNFVESDNGTDTSGDTLMNEVKDIGSETEKMLNTKKGVQGSDKIEKKRKKVAQVVVSTSKKGKEIEETPEVLKPDVSSCRISSKKRERLPVEVARRSGLTKKLHALKIKTLDGKIMENEVETEKNGDVPRYKMVNWGNFMSANSLKNGDILHFNFVTSTQVMELTNVDRI